MLALLRTAARFAGFARRRRCGLAASPGGTRALVRGLDLRLLESLVAGCSACGQGTAFQNDSSRYRTLFPSTAAWQCNGLWNLLSSAPALNRLQGRPAAGGTRPQDRSSDSGYGDDARDQIYRAATIVRRNAVRARCPKHVARGGIRPGSKRHDRRTFPMRVEGPVQNPGLKRVQQLATRRSFWSLNEMHVLLKLRPST